MAPSPQATAAASALSALAACNLKELHLKRADGSRILDSLHATCRSAGLIPHGTPDATPKERYLAVFDAALTGGLGCWILDYVEVVCADRHLTSNDPLEAYLLDGGFVKAWAQAALQAAEQAATSALQSDSAFLAFQAGPLQRQLSQIRILTTVLRALDRIRAIAAGGSALAAQGATVAAPAQDRLSVKAELRTSILLEQAFQVMDWVARQGLAEPRGAVGGRFGSYVEWSRAVAARRTRAAPRPLFLDSLLKALSLSGAYPSSSVQHMLHTLLLLVRDVEPATWAAKLALLAYYLQDAGLLDGPTGQPAPPQVAPGAEAQAGGGRAEAVLEDLRRTFRLSAGDVGLWQCYYLLDCAAPDAPGTEDPHLARACALLPACVSPSTPFACIEALLALGRPDVALAVDRGQAGSEAVGPSSRRPCRSLQQAVTLLEVRLRCGLLTEAFMLLRQHTADLAAAGQAGVRSHTLSFRKRGRAKEAIAAWRRWDARQAALAAASGQRRAPVLSELVSAALDAAHAPLPVPMHNVAVPGLDAEAAGTCQLPQLAPSQGAVGILAGLLEQTSPDQPLAVLPFHGSEPPPLITRPVQLPPPSYATSAAAPAATAAGSSAAAAQSDGGAAAAARPGAPLALSRPTTAAAQQQQQPQQFQAAQPFAPLPLLLPSAAPFRAPPGAGPSGSGAFGFSGSGGVAGGGGVGGGGGGGGLLFSVGAGVVAAGGPSATPGVPPVGVRTSKRCKPNDWLLG
ncbi:hypothetical protein GPECTOR_39g393 [Gonium pectorale]|uniref:ELYS-like domain-containing protein n=1 Tax=Gonium pectorale TaxID=33097 RepID=A0A150GAN5_GONPE|nr:hypothetical protein GPECTOR_39g393 [Gonium pectorale]|eukprot:KXZ46899.1 hypothetical protein GPECTOR_39g393 [Gonium pectorale]